ncbi:hypothetical protein [Pseudofulvibacter geojedonensis]|uniref:Lipoprotein n=1 Tax=Pseudofulvibacter geojedonensis TaxID=1123758 RepID=A0ABW3HY33_9FLAO
MHKHFLLIIITIVLISCKENKKNTNSKVEKETYEVEVDSYQISEEESEKLRIEDSINIEINKKIIEKESILKKNGNYTDRDQIVNILIKLGFLSSFKANNVALKEIVLKPDSKDVYWVPCKYKTKTTIEFNDRDSSPYLIASTSNLDTFYYYIDKISINKNGNEIEISLKSIAQDGSISDKYHIKPFMVYLYDHYVLEFNHKSFAIKSIVDSLKVEECDEPKRR